MALLVVTHLAAGGIALALGLLLSGLSPASARRRSALHWAFQRARSEAVHAREREAAARAELDAALRREVAARDEAEQSKALAAVLEAEMVAARWEKEELEQRAHPAPQQVDAAPQRAGAAPAVAALGAALRRAATLPPWNDAGAPEAPRREEDPEEVVRFSATLWTSAPWAGARPAVPFRAARRADG